MIKEDRISQLPDAILQHILSSIKPKQAVQTSILSKRWQNLWSSLPIIRFTKRFTPSYERFVTHFLSHRDNSPVWEFQLLPASPPMDLGLIEKCIEYAVNHGVQILHIDAYYEPRPFTLPNGFLAIKTLRELRLTQYIEGVVVPKPFVLPNLKTLYLESFKFEDGNDLYSLPKEPFSGFLDLEELTLYECGVSDMIISARKLKFLKISFRYRYASIETKIERISAPNLTSFRHEGPVSLVCPEIDFPCLERFYFHVYPHLSSHTNSMEKKLPENLARMLQKLGNARFVALTFETIKVLALGCLTLEQSPSPFRDIKCLNIIGRVYNMTDDAQRTVMNYLTKGSSYGDSVVVKYCFPKGIKEEH